MKKFISKLFSKDKNIIGLDIGKSSIKIMELSGDYLENVKIECYASVPIPRNLIDPNIELNNEAIEEIGKLVQKCWKKAGCSSKYVNVCINNNIAISKKVIIPNYNDSEDLRTAVEAEISKYIPSDILIEDLYLDYYTLGPNLNNLNESDMLIVATKKDKIDELRAIVESAGLIPEIIDVEMFSLQNLVKLMHHEEFMKKTYILADCSSTHLKMFVFRDGEIIANKDIQIGGMNLTDDIVNNLGLSYDVAEEMKIERKGDESYDLIEKNFLNNYKTEFISLISYFKSAISLEDIDDLILVGGVACIPLFEKIITDGLLDHPEIVIHNEPYIARPLENAEKKSDINMVNFTRDEAGLFLVSSLALRKYLRQY